MSQWREARVRFFESGELAATPGESAVVVDDDTLVVCERFRLVEILRVSAQI